MTRDRRQTGNPGSSNFAIADYPFYQLNRTVSRYNILIERLLREIQLDIPTWRVLMILGEASPQSVSQIAERAVINISTMVRIADRMKRSGYVLAEPSTQDRRVTQLDLTELGHERLAAARQLTAPLYHQAIAGFSGQDFGRFLDLIERLHANLGMPAPA